MNRPEDIFKLVADGMRFGSSISSVSESGGVSTITTDNIYTLQNGMLIEVGNFVYPVSNIIRTGLTEWTFDITATGITALTWQLALYYEFGRALEVGNTLEETKQDPTNKNKRFPLMWLLTDIEKDFDTIDAADYRATVIIGFIYISEDNLKAGQRLDNKFEPILDPLVELFKDKIQNSTLKRYFVWPLDGSKIKIKQTDKFKYGSVDGNRNVFNDITDAIELTIDLYFAMEENSCLN